MANMFQRAAQRLLGSTASVATAIVQKTMPRAFEISQRGRRLAAVPSVTTAINTQIRTYGASALARSRYLCTNNGYAASAKQAYVAAMVGHGIKPSTLGEIPAHKKLIQELWLDWVQESDADGVQDFYGQQNLGANELFEAGEFFLVEQEAPQNITVPLRYKMLQSEMLPYTLNWATGMAPGNYCDMGIEFNPAGERVAYHFYTQHPGDVSIINPRAVRGHTIRIPAERVLHVFKQTRAGQIRGIPYLLASLVTLAMLDLYDDAELERKRTAALFTAFITTNPQEGSNPESPIGKPETDPITDESVVNMQPGGTVSLLPGEDVTFGQPAEVGNSYEPFQYRNLLRAAAGMGVPYMAMTGDLRQANYGSIRAGLIEFKRRITADQFNILVHMMVRPVWTRFHDVAAAYDLLPWSASKYLAKRREHLRARYLTPAWEWVDPSKDIAAAKIAVDNGFTPRDDVVESQGYDPDENDERIKEGQDRLETLGIELPAAAAEAPAPAPAAPGEDDEPSKDGAEPNKEPANAE